jgi:hypothetical protein
MMTIDNGRKSIAQLAASLSLQTHHIDSAHRSVASPVMLLANENDQSPYRSPPSLLDQHFSHNQHCFSSSTHIAIAVVVTMAMTIAIALFLHCHGST